MKAVELDGNNFDNLDNFYDEVQRRLCPFPWFGHNLAAFNDVLAGGFGLFEVGEHIELIWINSAKSRKDLGYPETVRYLETFKDTFRPNDRLEAARRGEGSTLYEDLLGIIRDHPNIKLSLK